MKIKMLIMDVDGTLTDGKIYIGNNGEIMKAFDVKDGYAIAHLKEKGIIPVIITGRESAIVSNRAEELNIEHIYQGVNNKLDKMLSLAKGLNIDLSEIAFIGDDIRDLECIKKCGYSGCPNDANKEIKKLVNYVCEANGGEGAVREFVESILE